MGALRLYAASPPRALARLLPPGTLEDKLYEIHVLVRVLETLQRVERLDVVIRGSGTLPLRLSGGPIDRRRYAHFGLVRSGRAVADVWTDIEVTTLGHSIAGAPTPMEPGHLHEVDVIIVDHGTNGYPRHDQVWLAVECKHTTFGKNLLRQILGLRRELSYLRAMSRTRFNYWPESEVPADPASCVAVYSSDPRVVRFSIVPGSTFGIRFSHEPLT